MLEKPGLVLPGMTCLQETRTYSLMIITRKDLHFQLWDRQCHPLSCFFPADENVKTEALKS